jgi:hypothetical protein
MHNAPISRKSGVATVARLAPYFALGPISGPLTAGIVVNMRGGRPVLASMYGFLLVSWLLLAPVELVHLLPINVAHLL